ncbi:hypothetical protein evm_004308 [Chilo suppressalis]|nr:hypothetical protein evm_004308 [Chilo suppressalis]
MFCRPLYFIFVNENNLNITEEQALVEAEITALEPSPSEMNMLEKISEKPVSTEIYQYGLSTLHAWVRSMDCLIHISYRLDFKTWQAKDPSSKDSLKGRKLIIQQKFRDEMGLLVDIVKQGSGNTNDGNTARKFYVILPILQLSQKIDLKKIREHHSRKFSRKATKEDTFNEETIVSSDPYLSGIRPVLRKSVNTAITDDMKPLLISDDADRENIEFVDVNASMLDSDLEDFDDDEDTLS